MNVKDVKRKTFKLDWRIELAIFILVGLFVMGIIISPFVKICIGVKYGISSVPKYSEGRRELKTLAKFALELFDEKYSGDPEVSSVSIYPSAGNKCMIHVNGRWDFVDVDGEIMKCFDVVRDDVFNDYSEGEGYFQSIIVSDGQVEFTMAGYKPTVTLVYTEGIFAPSKIYDAPNNNSGLYKERYGLHWFLCATKDYEKPGR